MVFLLLLPTSTRPVGFALRHKYCHSTSYRLSLHRVLEHSAAMPVLPEQDTTRVIDSVLRLNNAIVFSFVFAAGTMLLSLLILYIYVNRKKPIPEWLDRQSNKASTEEQEEISLQQLPSGGTWPTNPAHQTDTSWGILNNKSAGRSETTMRKQQ